MKNPQKTASRYGLIDALRGLAILNMLAYHLCYDIFMVFGVDAGWYAAAPVVFWERCICCVFIIVSGISLNLSSRPYRRGIIINLCGLAVTAVTALFLPSELILFGVLNLIGCAMLLTAALRPVFSRIPPLVGAGVSFALFALTYGVPRHFIGIFGYQLLALPDALYATDITAPLGFYTAAFRSSDYFPLLPWVFLFFFGYFLWQCFVRCRAQEFFRPSVPMLGFIGRHSLSIYLLHQPVLYGICYLIFTFR